MSGSVLRKHRLERDFTITPNAPARNHRLSLRARGLLWFLLTQPDGFPVNAADLASDLADAREEGARAVKEGREAVETAIAELADYGHITRRREQNARGQWVTFTDVYELPELQHITDNGSPVVGQAATDNGSTGAGSPVAMDRRTDREELPVTPNGVTGRVTSRDLLAEHLDALGHDLATKGQLAATIKRLLERVGVPDEEIRAALAFMRERGLTSPSVLPALVDEIRGGGKRQRRPERYALNGDHVTPPAELKAWADRRRAQREQTDALPELEVRT